MKRMFSMLLVVVLLLTGIAPATAAPMFVFAPEQAVQAQTAAPTAASTPTPSPESTPEPIRYGKTNASGVNVRARADTSSDAVDKIANKGMPFLLEEEVYDTAGVLWYRVDIDGKQGHIRGDLVEVLPDEAAYQEALAAATAKKTSNASSKVKATAQEAAASSFAQGASKPTQQPTQQPTQPPARSGSVWVGNTGECYHSHAGCSGMKNPSQVSVAEAVSMGRRPCKKCY